MPEIIRTADAPGSPTCSQGTKASGFLRTAGLVGIDPARKELAGPTIQKQVRQATANCEAVLAAGGATLADVVELVVLLADPETSPV